MYGLRMNVEKTTEMRISRQPYPVQTIRDQKQQENMKYFNHMDSMITN